MKRAEEEEEDSDVESDEERLEPRSDEDDTWVLSFAAALCIVLFLLLISKSQIQVYSSTQLENLTIVFFLSGVEPEAESPVSLTLHLPQK